MDGWVGFLLRSLGDRRTSTRAARVRWPPSCRRARPRRWGWTPPTAPRGRRRPAPASRPCPAAAWRPPNAGGSRRCPPVPETAEQESYPAVHSISSSLTGKMTDLRGIVLVKVVSVAGLKLLFVDFALRQRYVSSMLLRVEQAARRLGVSPVTIRRWTATGFLPCTRTAGGHRRIDEHDIDDLAKAIGNSNHLAAQLAREREVDVLINTSVALAGQLGGQVVAVADGLGEVVDVVLVDAPVAAGGARAGEETGRGPAADRDRRHTEPPRGLLDAQKHTQNLAASPREVNNEQHLTRDQANFLNVYPP